MENQSFLNLLKYEVREKVNMIVSQDFFLQVKFLSTEGHAHIV